MLNVSWAKKRAEFVFVFAIGKKQRKGKVMSRTIMEGYKPIKINKRK